MKILKPTFNLLMLLLTANLCLAQSHQIIIQLEEDIAMRQLKTNSSISPVTSYKQISKSLNIWLIEMPTTDSKKENTLANWQNHPQIKVAQFNEAVELRNTTNDQYLDEQWQYFNKGEEQGLTDADIDALKAWDITTGGVTALGDEIVVAVIDGGVDINHPDLMNNLWTNVHEIPNNQIDDDKNGYVDDYYGWNFNDTIPDVSNYGYGHWHGTPVAGIIGAEGNNYEGVCGVNWRVKIMNLVANQTVADVIAAYDYILEMRKRYNETNGQEGAFVVTSNASLGITGGKPADHPLWCAIYNALGEAGVLNVAATANQNLNVDVRGDLPTTCSSNYLISVTNTNRKDELDFAAYGRTHIDLGAPGSGVFTISNFDNYGTFGGTSAAAPHVAGAIALLYALPNQSFAQAAHQNPAAIALMIKQIILEGTDPVFDLQNKTLSGGRLNLFNSLCALQSRYEESSCLESPLTSIEMNEILYRSDEDLFHISFQLEGETYLKTRLFNSAGQLIHQQNIKHINTGMHQLSFLLNDQPHGVYYVFLHGENFNESVKLLK